MEGRVREIWVAWRRVEKLLGEWKRDKSRKIFS